MSTNNYISTLTDNSENTDSSDFIPAKKLANLMLDIGTYLLSSGAHCGRVKSNLTRMADTWDFDIDIDPTFKGLLISVSDRNNSKNMVTSYRNSPAHNVKLSMLTDISHLSWKVQDNKLPIEQVEIEFSCIKEQKGYKNWVIAIAVGFSCAGLCVFSGGDVLNAIVAFWAAATGFGIKVRISNMNFNPMISIGAAAFVTTLISGLCNIYNIGAYPQAAMATAVLYLIPGVPLINCVIDLIEGYLSSAVNRALFSGFILLCIAAGMTICITLMGINNFN